MPSLNRKGNMRFFQISSLSLATVVLATSPAFAAIETQVALIDNGETIFAPKTTAASGIRFESIVGQPVDDTSDALTVGIALKGSVSSAGGTAKFDLTVILREADTTHSTERVQVRTFKTKEYSLRGDADFGQEVKIRLADARFIVLKFIESDAQKLNALKSAKPGPQNITTAH